MCHSMNIERYYRNVKYVFYAAFIIGRLVRILHYALCNGVFVAKDS